VSVPTGGLAYSDIRLELSSQRFGTQLVPSINRWINTRYGVIWGDSEWPFKRIRRETWAVSGAAPVMPPAYWKTTRLETSTGDVLVFLDTDDFDDAYPVGTPVGSTPEAYTVLAGQLYIGPTCGAVTLYHSYERRPCHYNTADVVVPGLLSADTDYPIWPPEWHYALVVGAGAVGLKMQNDPTWDALEQEFGTILNSMREDLLPPDQYANTQYGRDTD